MLFHSVEFLFFFLPITVFVFYTILKLDTKSNYIFIWLFISSLFFYGWWEISYVPLILISLIFNFTMGRRLSASTPPPKKALLIFGVFANLLLLGYFKYTNFFIDNINLASNSDIQIAPIILPLAISFFTFQQIAWLVDNARGQVEQSNSFIEYGVFVTFFPQLIAGPIVHHREMMVQFTKDRIKATKKYNNIIIGISIISIGLFKKVIIADQLSLYADNIFNSAAQGQELNAIEAWIGTLSYSFQIYFDFSGYSDMALGLGRLFGIRLPLNFLSPYKATNIIDFWRRWHMTLSRFLRDYLYIPLGGNKKGATRRHMNLIITMLIGGLWHGAAWTFVIWGGIHGILLMFNHLWLKIMKSLNLNIKTPVILARLITFLCVTIAWVFFRAENLDSAFTILNSLTHTDNLYFSNIYQEIFTSSGTLRERFGVQNANLAVPTLLIASFLCFICPNTAEIMRKTRYFTANSLNHMTLSKKGLRFIWSATPLWGIFIGILMTVSLLKSIYEPSQVFLYFQF